jgi:tetratricopeptide (TPR) repeat protein
VALNKRKILDSARKYAQKGAQEKALKEYAQLLQSDPKDAKLRIEVGDAYRRWGRIEEAIETYSKVAQQYTQEGFDARAVAVYKQIQSLDPQRAAVYEPLADLYQRMGLSAESAQAYQSAAEVHQKAGRKREALGALRKLCGLDPSNTASRIKVSDLLAQEGMKEEAIAEFSGVAAELERQRDIEGATRCLARVVALAPERADFQLRLAGRLIESGRVAEAEAHVKLAVAASPREPAPLEMLGDLYRRLGRDAEMQETYRNLAGYYRERGDTDRAREILQRVGAGEAATGFDASPSREFSEERPEEAQGVTDGDPSVFGAVSEFEAGVELDDEPLLLVDSELGDSEDLFGSGADAAAALEDDDDVEGTTQFTPPTPRGAAAKRAPEVAASADLEQLLAEASVYLRYGKRRQAIENLQRILDEQPDHRPALEKFGEAQVEAGETEAAIATWQRAYQLASTAGEHDAAAVLRDRIRALGGSVANMAPPLGVATSAAAASAPAAIDSAAEEEVYLDFDDEPVAAEATSEPAEIPESEFSLEVEIDDSELGDSLSDISALTEDIESADAEPAAAPGPASASASQSQARQILEEIEEADFYLQQGLLDEAEAIFVRLARIAPNHPRVLVRLGEIAAERGGDPDSTASGLAASASVPGALAEDSIEALIDAAREPHASALPAEESLELEIETEVEVAREIDLGEVDATHLSDPESSGELADQPLALESVAAIEIEVSDPERAAIEVEPFAEEPEEIELAADAPISAQIEVADSEVQPAEVEVSDAADTGDFDLAAALADELDREDQPLAVAPSRSADTAALGFQAVFDAFKRGVESALSPGDADAHYDLGIAYREMGLYEDALREFQQVAASSARAIDGLHMMGVCALDLGRAADAVAALERGLAQPELRREQEIALCFELGRAFDLLGDVARARESWESVVALDPLFCDVQERLLRLEQGAKPEAAEALLMDDTAELPGGAGYENFADLMASIDDEAPPAAAAEVAPPGPPEPAPDANEISQSKRRRRRISYL